MTNNDTNQPTVPDLATLRRRGTMKWRGCPEDVLPLWVAESDFDTCPAVNRAIQDAVDREYFGYPAGEDELKKALSNFYSRRFGWTFDPDWVRIVPDVVKGVTVAIDELTPAGSAIVLPVPSYHPFFDVPTASHRPSIEVPMKWTGSGEAGVPNGNGEWTFDLDALEDIFANGTASARGRVVVPHTSDANPAPADSSEAAPTGSLILCNPYNPLGRAFRADELRAVIELAAKYGVRVISDEIHAPMVLDGAKHTPAASVSDIAAENTVTVTATSKGWNTAGLRCAQMIFSSEQDRQAMAQVHKLRTGEGSTLGLVAATAAYNEGEAWLNGQVNYLSENLDLLERRIPEVLPGAKFIRPEATYLLWLDLTDVPGLGLADTTTPAALIASKARVAFNEGTGYGTGGEGHVRLNFATSPKILNEALDRIAEAFPQ